MFPIRGVTPPFYRRLGKSELDVITDIQLDEGRADRFLGPLPEIQTAVRSGPAHAMVAIEAPEGFVGFYVIHPDTRDRTCWWLGWLAIDRRWEGRGYGSAAVRAAITQLRQLAGCRRIRLLVASDNERALGLYRRARFRVVGLWALTGEMILEFSLALPFEAADLAKFLLAAVAARARRVFRHRRLRLSVGPHAARVIGVERGPPGVAVLAR
jgi:GNAT superfamily N-acetyltransferase